MTKLLEQALREIERLAPDDQNAAAGALLDYVKHMRNVRLTDAQVAEVRPPQDRSQSHAGPARRGRRTDRPPEFIVAHSQDFRGTAESGSSKPFLCRKSA